MIDHPCFRSTGERPVDVPRLSSGVRVRYDLGRWERNLAMGGCYRFVPEWAQKPWASTRIGTVVTVEDYSPFHDQHPWGCPPYATPVRFDGEERVTWVRTAILDAIGWAVAREEKQPELALAFA